MKVSTSVFAALIAGFLVTSPALAQPSPAEQCLEQCKQDLEQCIQAAGDDADRLQDCSSQALQCIESCKGS